MHTSEHATMLCKEFTTDRQKETQHVIFLLQLPYHFIWNMMIFCDEQSGTHTILKPRPYLWSYSVFVGHNDTWMTASLCCINIEFSQTNRNDLISTTMSHHSCSLISWQDVFDIWYLIYDGNYQWSFYISCFITVA